ncbi:ATP-binding protein [Streptomyces sp. NPDC005438]|uniref:ATP-binding protein n=1 Tax=Streptomyces sp. NPDC005438 TaxID=3156880 RepID=UPI0033AE0A91
MRTAQATPTAEPPTLSSVGDQSVESSKESATPGTDVLTVPVTAQAVALLRRRARVASRRWALSEDVEDALCVVVTELVTNVLLHSGSARVTLRLAVGHRGVTVVVEDSGRWRSRLGVRRAVADAGAPCGRGLPLVRAHTRALRVLRSPHGTRVHARIPTS